MWKVEIAECENPTTGEEKIFINVIPDFGLTHHPHPDCWCEPQADEGVLIHKQQH